MLPPESTCHASPGAMVAGSNAASSSSEEARRSKIRDRVQIARAATLSLGFLRGSSLFWSSASNSSAVSNVANSDDAPPYPFRGCARSVEHPVLILVAAEILVPLPLLPPCLPARRPSWSFGLIPWVGRVERYSGETCSDLPTAALGALLVAVMARLAQRLPVAVAVPEQRLVATMRDDVVNHPRCCHAAITLAAHAQLVACQIGSSRLGPCRGVSALMCRAALLFGLALVVNAPASIADQRRASWPRTGPASGGRHA